MPPPEWIFHELLQTNSTALLYGPSTVGKTFLILELICALAVQHHGIFRPMQPGRILYISGEGEAGLGIRLKAWEKDRGVLLPPDNPVFVGQAVQIADPKERRLFITAIRKEFGERPPIAIVYDTLARCAVGLDENSAKDMGMLVDGLEQIRVELQSSQILVHHSTKKDPKVERGSGAIFGAVDTTLSMQRDGAYLKLECPKQKNGERTPTRRLRLKKSAESLVLDAGEVAEARDKLEQLHELMVVEGAKPVTMAKALFMKEGYPPLSWDWDGESPVCAITTIGSRVTIEQINPEDADFRNWLAADRRLRQESKTDVADVNPFVYTCIHQEWWRLDEEGQKQWLEARRHAREDRLAGRGDPYPTTSDWELAWWVWGIAEMGVTQADVLRWYDIGRGVLQRAVQTWKKYGLLPVNGSEK